MKDPIRILFVEDDPEMAAVYRENFTKPEFESETANNGKEAIEYLKRTKRLLHFVVTDNFMPEMDGITLLRKIQDLYPEIKVIVVTGYGDWGTYVDAHNLGCCKFIDKPVRMTELKDLIRKLQAE